MRKTLKLVRREYRAAVRTKGFLLGLLLAPVLFGGSAIGMVLLKGRVDTRDRRVAVLDRSGVLAPVLVEAARARNERELCDPATGRKVKPAWLLEAAPPAGEEADRQRLALSDRVRRGELHGFLEVGPGVLHPGAKDASVRISYHARSAALDPIRAWLGGVLNRHLQEERARRLGVPDSSLPELFSWIEPQPMGLLSADAATGAVVPARRASRQEALLVPVILTALMFMMMMMGAMPLLSAVMEEKAQRIAEVLLGSVRPFQFMMGKVLGGLAVALTSSAVYVAGGALTVHWLGYGAYIPYGVLPWFFAFMALAMLMTGSILAAFGAACNDAKEAQALTFPAILPMIVPMFVLMPVALEPTSGFATALSLVPPFTPMLMTLRLGTPAGIPAWQPWAGLVGVLLFTLFTVWAGGRLFRVAILMQGTPPKLKNLVRWAFKG